MSIKDWVFNTRPSTSDLGRLVLRLGAGASLFLKHGLEKLTGYSTMVQHFPDPIHIGPHPSLAFALLSDGICSVLMVIGLGTRAAAAVSLINLTTAFLFVHHAAFFTDSHAELVWLYMTIFATIVLVGPGRFSLDAKIDASDRKL